MSEPEDDRFLSRWSRRKIAAREGRPLEEPPAEQPLAGPDVVGVATAPPTSGAEGEPPPELPPVESLRGLASDYRDFMRANVDPALKRAALRKLFADPHFNVMDGLDIYIDDYSIPDPIPDAMMAKLEHAKTLFRPLVEARDAAARQAADAASVPASGAVAPGGLEAAEAATDCPPPPTIPDPVDQDPDGSVGIEESR